MMFDVFLVLSRISVNELKVSQHDATKGSCFIKASFRPSSPALLSINELLLSDCLSLRFSLLSFLMLLVFVSLSRSRLIAPYLQDISNMLRRAVEHIVI